MKYSRIVDDNQEILPDTKLELTVTDDDNRIDDEPNVLYLLPQITPPTTGPFKFIYIFWLLFAVPSPKFQRNYPAELISSLGITRTTYNDCIAKFEEAAACSFFLRLIWFITLPAIIGAQVYMIYRGLKVFTSWDAFFTFLPLFLGIQAGFIVLYLFRNSTNKRMDQALITINELLAKEIVRTHPSEDLLHPKCKFQYEYVFITMVTIVVAIDERVLLDNMKLPSTPTNRRDPHAMSNLDSPFKPENSIRLALLEDRYDGRIRRHRNNFQSSSSCIYYIKLFFLRLLQIYPEEGALPNMHYSPLLSSFCTEDQYKLALKQIYQASLRRNWERNFLFLHRVAQITGIVAGLSLGLKFDFSSTEGAIKSGILLAVIIVPIFCEVVVVISVNRRLAKCLKPLNTSFGFPKHYGFQWRANIRIMKIYITLDTMTYLEPVSV